MKKKDIILIWLVYVEQPKKLPEELLGGLGGRCVGMEKERSRKAE